MSAKKDCKFCDKNGLLWLPLRYSVVGSDYPNAFKRLPEIDGKKLGKGVVDIKLTYRKSRYAVRLLRPGFLYVLLITWGCDIGRVRSTRRRLFVRIWRREPAAN